MNPTDFLLRRDKSVAQAGFFKSATACPLAFLASALASTFGFNSWMALPRLFASVPVVLSFKSSKEMPRLLDTCAPATHSPKFLNPSRFFQSRDWNSFQSSEYLVGPASKTGPVKKARSAANLGGPGSTAVLAASRQAGQHTKAQRPRNSLSVSFFISFFGVQFFQN